MNTLTTIGSLALSCTELAHDGSPCSRPGSKYSPTRDAHPLEALCLCDAHATAMRLTGMKLYPAPNN